MPDLVAQLEQQIATWREEARTIEAVGHDGSYVAECADELSALCRSWQEEQGKETCKWSEDDDGIFHTDCGHSFNFDTDGPRENGGWFCFYCGKSLEPVRFSAAPAPKGR